LFNGVRKKGATQRKKKIPSAKKKKKKKGAVNLGNKIFLLRYHREELKG